VQQETKVGLSLGVFLRVGFGLNRGKFFPEGYFRRRSLYSYVGTVHILLLLRPM